MPYCTQADILESLSEAELIQLTDDAGAGTVDPDVVERAIADADATVDAHCQGRYSVPLASPVPGVIRRISVDITVYNLYSRRDDTMPETRKERMKSAERFLEKVARGEIRLGTAQPAPETTGGSVDIESQDRIFDRGKLRGF